MQAPPQHPPVTVLNVNDDEGTRYMITRRLESAGFVVREASTGYEGLARAAERPDVIVLDVKLPDISGFDVCQRIKADPRTASIAVLLTSSAVVTPRERVLGLDGGADAYLVQPVEAIELVATVKALARARRVEDERVRLLRRAEDALVAAESSERRYRFLAESLPQSIWTSTPDGALDFVNERLASYLGRSPADVVRDGFFGDVHPDDRAGVVASWARAIAEGEPFESEERLRRGDGVYRWFLTRATPMRDGAGRVVAWFGTSTDIEDRKRAELERDDLLAREQHARARAEESNRAKDDFLATVSHELRTPLNAMLGWARMLRSGELEGEVRERAIEAIDRNAVAQAQLIEDLLDVSRIVSGKLNVELRSVDLAGVVDAALDAVRPAMAAKRIAFESSFDPTTPAVYGDANRLQQIVWNLLSNAIKFAPERGHIELAVRHGGGRIEIAVRDDGRGIDEAFLPYLFERFKQADGKITRAHGGLGLGLAISRHLVELHGGSIGATSEGLGRGATFTVELPVASRRVASTPPPRARFDHSLPLDHPAELRDLRVLLVDDEPDTRELLVAILHECGAVPTAVGSAREAFETLQRIRPDVLVSDIGMPGEDGYALIRKVRTLSPEAGGRTPAAALTAYARFEDRRMALHAGFQLHIPKPVEPGEFITGLADLVGIASSM